ncbi:MAG: erythromycin esterase family protein [Candidatus Aminicenantes bacterium]|nr:erythromycin esterase family protein [Candidatus Aminicenantes bacterium]
MIRPRGRAVIAKSAIALLVLCLPGFLAAQGASPRVRSDWAASARAEHHPLTTLEAGAPDDSDLLFLDAALAGRRIVALGESAHGVAEFSLVKVRLIKYLHEKLGYDVIAFESSIFEAWAADRRAAGQAAETTLRDSLFGVWHNRETLELFEYLRGTKSTDHPLILAGFDVQISSARGAAERPRILSEAIGRVDPAYAAEVERRDGEFVVRFGDPSWLQANAGAFRTFYANLAWWLGANAPALAAAHPESPELPAILRRTALSMDAFILERTRTGAARTNAREAGMADNVTTLAREIYPGRKIILWGHNAHIGRSPAADGSFSVVPLGTRLAQAFGDAYYAIGLFAGRGEACGNDRTPYALTPPRDNGLEAILLAAGPGALMVDLAGARPNRLNTWMSSLLPAKDWGFRDTALVPRERFDGLLFIRDVHRPDYLDAESEDGREAPTLPQAPEL